jgi:curli biogenesis system outer membrane secretion channel CsgG
MRKLVFALFVFWMGTSHLLLAQKKRVAVMNFDYGTVHRDVAAIFGSDTDVGKGIADLLVNKLVSSGVYSVVERKDLDKVMTEQNFSNSDRADPSSAAKLGRILGVDAIVIGSITQFGRDDKSRNIGGLGGLTGRFGIGGVGKKEAKAEVAVSARLVSTDTAEILAVANGKGQSTRSGTTLLGAGGSSSGIGAGNYDMTSKNFGDTIIGEAVNEAVSQLGKQLDNEAPRIPAKSVHIEGLVADATGGTVILNVGKKAGVNVGDKLEIRRAVREIRDPATGKVIRKITDKIGEVTITDVDELSAVGTFSGSSPAKVGDTVTSP